MQIKSIALATVLSLALSPLALAADRPAHPTDAGTPDEPGRGDASQP